MKKKGLFLFTALWLTVGLCAEDIRLAVIDFSVETANDEYLYLGKGYAEFIGISLLKSGKIRLIDRKERNMLMEEMKFSLSGLADEEASLEVGRLLTANYLLSGEIYDMGGELTVTYQITDTETGEIILNDMEGGRISRYKRVVEAISNNIVKVMSGIEEEPVEAPAEILPEKQEETVILAFSEAMDSLDRGEEKKALQTLEKVKRIDRANRGVTFYLNKLADMGSRYNVVPPPYFTWNNPALLGMEKEDRIYYGSSGSSLLFTEIFSEGEDPASYYPFENTYGPAGTDRYAVLESMDARNLGYSFPLPSGLGLGIEAYQTSIGHKTKLYNSSVQHVSHNMAGANISCGYPLSDRLSLGFALMGGAVYETKLIYESLAPGEEDVSSSFIWGGEAGLIVKSRDSSLTYTLYGGLSNFTDYENDVVNGLKGDAVSAPLYLDHALIYTFNENRTSAVIKNILEIYLADNLAPYIQVITPLEHWVVPWLSLRAAPVMTLTPSGTTTFGLGASAGATLVVLKKWELDITGTYRNRPSRAVYEEIVPDLTVGFTVTKRGTFFK